MFDSLSFRAMESGIAAMKMREEAIVHNLANVETPGFKAQEVSFRDVLEQERNGGTIGRYNFVATVSTDETTEMRPDGNNVDVDKQNVELVSTYFQTAALYQKISGTFSNVRYVLTNAFK